MATLEDISGIRSFIEDYVVNKRRSYNFVSELLKSEFPSMTRGFSARSIRRYCEKHGIHATSRLTCNETDNCIRIIAYKVSTW